MTGDRKLLVKIANYYYKKGLTQNEIAKKLLMSRQKVNRLIKRLTEEKIVTIHIDDYENSYVDLENKFEERFNLKQVIIIPNVDGEDIIQSLGAAGADYLEEIISSRSIIGVSWGRTIYNVGINLKKVNNYDGAIVQLVGGGHRFGEAVHADEITRIFSEKYNCKPYYMYAPLFVKNKEAREVLMAEQSIKASFEMIHKCDIAVIGIGGLRTYEPFFKQNYLTEENLKILLSLNGVGNMCLRYFDIEGKILDNQINSIAMGVSMEELKRIPTVIGIAGGNDKVKAILGALNGGYLDILITDNKTAVDILQEVNCK